MSQHAVSQRSLKFRMTITLVITLAVVLAVAALFIQNSVFTITHKEMEESANLTATSIADSIKVFGELGEMKGLARLLVFLKEQRDLESVHPVRGPVSVADFGVRSEGEPRDELEREVLQTGKPVRRFEADKHLIRYVVPIKGGATCVSCHTKAKAEDIYGAVSVGIRTDSIDSGLTALSWLTWGIFVLATIAGASVLAFRLNRSIIRPLEKLGADLEVSANNVRNSAAEVAGLGERLADQSSSQAAGLEETSSAVEEISSMNRNNMERSEKVNSMTRETAGVTEKGHESMTRMFRAMEQINGSSEETANIIKAIEEIAFQTNLLALNAAVEAARAGESGAGFAVVADEVRALARRSSDAARNTANLIEQVRNHSHNGLSICKEVSAVFNGIQERVKSVSVLMEEVAGAVREQNQGVEQINLTITEIDRTTQANAANAQESSAAGQRMFEESDIIIQQVNDLITMLRGTGEGGHESGGGGQR